LRAILHQRAANAARLAGDRAAAFAHMDAAEYELADRPLTFDKANVAVARVLQYAVTAEPEQFDRAAARALELAAALPDRAAAHRLQLEVQEDTAMALVDRGDPGGFDELERALRMSADVPSAARESVSPMLNVYTEAVVSLFQREAANLRERIHAGFRKHD